MHCTVTPAALIWQVAAWLRVGGRPCMKLKERARWILYIFSVQSLQGRLSREPERFCNWKRRREKKRDGKRLETPSGCEERGRMGRGKECWEECRNNSSFTPEILILQRKVTEGGHSR